MLQRLLVVVPTRVEPVRDRDRLSGLKPTPRRSRNLSDATAAERRARACLTEVVVGGRAHPHEEHEPHVAHEPHDGVGVGVGVGEVP